MELRRPVLFDRVSGFAARGAQARAYVSGLPTGERAGCPERARRHVSPAEAAPGPEQAGSTRRQRARICPSGRLVLQSQLAISWQQEGCVEHGADQE